MNAPIKRDEFAAFLRSDPKRVYEYSDSDNCAIAQYLRSLGHWDVGVGPTRYRFRSRPTWRNPLGWLWRHEYRLDQELDLAVCNACHQGFGTFGDAWLHLTNREQAIRKFRKSIVEAAARVRLGRELMEAA